MGYDYSTSIIGNVFNDNSLTLFREVMKYYDGMGTEVTDYVHGLVARIKELEAIPEAEPVTELPKKKEEKIDG